MLFLKQFTNINLSPLQLIIYLVCFDLAENIQTQIAQIKYWLDYLHSLLSHSQQDYNSKEKWRVVLVGTRADKSPNLKSVIEPDTISKWQATWSSLPLHHKIFITSQTNTASIENLLGFLKVNCDDIMSKFSRRVPKAYLTLLQELKHRVQHKRHPFINIKDFNNSTVKQEDQLLGLGYLHAVGDIVMLADGLVCTDPKYISLLMSNFISPEAVQMNLPHITSKKVEILTSEQVGKVLLLKENDSEYGLSLFFYLFLTKDHLAFWMT